MIEICSLRRSVTALMLPAVACFGACREPDIVQVRPDPLRVVLSPSPIDMCEGRVWGLGLGLGTED